MCTVTFDVDRQEQDVSIRFWGARKPLPPSFKNMYSTHKE
jgi:hypothetical protein